MAELPEKYRDPAETDLLTRITEMMNSSSSMMERTDDVTRDRIHLALIHRSPKTYRAVYEKFNLEAAGVSFTAFYYYARRVRIQAAIIEKKRVELPDGVNAQDILPELLASKLLEAAIDPEAKARSLHRLAETYRVASQIQLARKRLNLQGANDRQARRFALSNDLCDLLKKYAQVRRAEFAADIVRESHRVDTDEDDD